ncbi:MAG: hypothetical protein AAF705_15965, partial [Bacteroidota bacterium]
MQHLEAQSPNSLLYQGDTLYLFSNPLDIYIDRDTNRIAPRFKRCDDYRWQGYYTWWTVRNDSLFLLKIESCNRSSLDSLEEKVQLSTLFPNQPETVPIFANWVNDTIYNPYGQFLHYETSSFFCVYEYDRAFIFHKGVLKATKTYQNQVYKSPFIENPDSLIQFLGKNIHWDKLPLVGKEEKPRVILNFKTDSQGYIIDPKVLRSSGPAYEAEILKILPKLGKWCLFIRR